MLIKLKLFFFLEILIVRNFCKSLFNFSLLKFSSILMQFNLNFSIWFFKFIKLFCKKNLFFLFDFFDVVEDDFLLFLMFEYFFS